MNTKKNAKTESDIENFDVILAPDEITEEDADALSEKGLKGSSTIVSYDDAYRNHPYTKEFRRLPAKEQNQTFYKYACLVEEEDISDTKRNLAYEKIFASLYAFIAGIISQMCRKYVSSGYREDLFQSAYTGVLMHLDEYDPDRGQPSTFFFKHIRFELQACMRNVSGASKYYDAISMKVQRAITHFQNIDKPYSIVDLARATDLSVGSVEAALRCINAANAGMIEDLLSLQSEDDSPELAAEKTEKKNLIESALSRLDPIQRSCVKLYYGFGTGEHLSLSKIAKVLNMSPDSVKKAFNRGMRCLRNDEELVKTRGYIETPREREAAIECASMPGYNVGAVEEAELELIDGFIATHDNENDKKSK